MTTAAAKITAVCIKYTEGYIEICDMVEGRTLTSALTWSAVFAMLRETAPEGPTYQKLHLTVRFDDGAEKTGRVDVQRGSENPFPADAWTAAA